MVNIFFTLPGNISFLELYLQSAFSIFVFRSNSTAVEKGDHTGINFLESRPLSSAVPVWNLGTVILCGGIIYEGEKGKRKRSFPTYCNWKLQSLANDSALETRERKRLRELWTPPKLVLSGLDLYQRQSEQYQHWLLSLSRNCPSTWVNWYFKFYSSNRATRV